jgi:hypothetical protein
MKNGGWTGVCTTMVKRFPRRRVYIGQTGVHSGNRGIWHSEPRPAWLDVSEGLAKATCARGGETDEADNLSRDIDVRVRHTAVYPG